MARSDQHKGVATFWLADEAGKDAGTNLYDKRILYEGTFTHPHDTKKNLVITKEHIRDAIKNFENGALDRVQMYFTHNEDPRNLVGKVVGLRDGIEAADGKYSLYA